MATYAQVAAEKIRYNGVVADSDAQWQFFFTAGSDATEDQIDTDWQAFKTSWSSFTATGSSSYAGDPDDSEWSLVLQYEAQGNAILQRMQAAGASVAPSQPSAGGLSLANLFPALPAGPTMTMGVYVAAGLVTAYVFAPFLHDLFGFAGDLIPRRRMNPRTGFGLDWTPRLTPVEKRREAAKRRLRMSRRRRSR